MELRNLVEHNVPQPEIALFRAFYSSQSGAAHGSRAFNIQRGAKQVDILSPYVFQCCFGVCFAEVGKMPTLWHSHGSDRCTNTGVPTARLDKQTRGIHAISSIGTVASPCAGSGVVDAVE